MSKVKVGIPTPNQKTVQHLMDTFGIGRVNAFTAMDVFLICKKPSELECWPQDGTTGTRKVCQRSALELEDDIRNRLKFMTFCVQSIGRLLVLLQGEESGGGHLIRHETKSKKPVKHWIQESE